MIYLQTLIHNFSAIVGTLDQLAIAAAAYICLLRRVKMLIENRPAIATAHPPSDALDNRFIRYL